MTIAPVLVLFLFTPFAFAEDHPKFAPHVTRLTQSHEHVARNPAPDFWRINSYYVPQRDGGSCAAATLSMVLNALRADDKLQASDKLVTQNALYEKIQIFKLGADPGIRGVSLDGFGRLLAQAFKDFGLKGWSYEVVRAEKTPAFKKKLHDLLVANEKSKDDFVLALFLQKDLTGDPDGNVGHFAPVGAFDGKRVLVFDPDREWYEPYWVPEDVFYEGVTDSKADSVKSGGYIRIWRSS